MQIFSEKRKNEFWLKIFFVFFIVILFSNFFSKILVDKFLSDGFLYSYEDKLNILASETDNKTVFVGGSSVLFGVSAKYYTELSGKPAVNMGLNAGAYDLYLSSIQPYLKKGDTVVLALEYDAYIVEWQKMDNICLDLANVTKNYHKTLPFIKRLTYYYKQMLRYCNRVFDIVYKLALNKLDSQSQLYVRKNVVEYGDFNSELTKGCKDIEKHSVKSELNQDALDGILKHIEFMEEKGVTVFVVYPPVYASKEDKTFEEIDVKLKNVFKDRILGNYDDWVCDTNEYFFDTPYHLNSEGILKHTEYYHNLILKKQMKNF